MNSLNFTGNLGGDCETRHTQSGKSITTFSVALSSGWGDNKHTTWIRCNMWGNRGESVAPYLLKGTQVAVSGEFSAKEWTAKDGTVKTSCEVNVQDVTLIGSKPQNQGQAPQQQQSSAPAPANDFDQDIPF